MKYPKKTLIKAIQAHFACDKKTLVCHSDFESYSNVAIDFMNYFASGSMTDNLTKALRTKRYSIKEELVNRYLKNSAS